MTEIFSAGDGELGDEAGADGVGVANEGVGAVVDVAEELFVGVCGVVRHDVVDGEDDLCAAHSQKETKARSGEGLPGAAWGGTGRGRRRGERRGSGR